MHVYNIGLRRRQHIMCFAVRSCFDYHRFTTSRL